jgi:segregation and condensation protein B
MIAPHEAERMVEALLFAAAEPLTLDDLAERLPAGADIPAALKNLAAQYEARGVQLSCVGGGWRFTTATDLAFLMTREREETRRLSRAAQETLAIIAYHQPITRVEIESIRGVQSSAGTLEGLARAGLVRMRGRRRTPGRPVTWGTTDAFLAHYGIESLADLPGAAEMKAAGLLGLDLPADFTLPAPETSAAEEDPLGPDDAPEFALDFLDEPTGAPTPG